MRRRPDLYTYQWRKVRLVVLNRDGWRCQLCGVPLGRYATVDHIRPHALGGTMEAGNLRAACNSCNVGRSNRYRDGWRVVKRMLPTARRSRFG